MTSALAGWSDSAHGALSRRLANAVRQAVSAGLIIEGSRLPPERTLARALGVGRSTVTSALDELRLEGVVESRQGSGTVVRGTGAAHLGGGEFGTTRIAEHLAELHGVDLAAGNPADPSHWPAFQIEVCDLISEGGGPGVHPTGLATLRSSLAERHSAQGLHTGPDEIHVTSGAHQAMALILRACCAPGDKVAVEETNYPGIFDIIDSLRARTAALATDSAGVLPEALERALCEQRTRVVYIQNGPHNPTGRLPAPGRLRELAAILDRHDALVIEDSTLADLAFEGRVQPELAHLCRHALVASIGSFSKVAWAGLRIGWMRAPAPLIQRTMQLRLAGDLGPSVPSQLFALRLLPQYDELAATRRSTLAGLVSASIERVRADFPGWQVDEPSGCAMLWIALPVADTGPFVQLARRYGVHVAPGSVARADRAADPHIRVCVDRPWAVVDTGLQRLELAWKDYCRQSGPVLG